MARSRLDREAVASAAAEIVDRDGWAYLTMTGLAVKLGVRAPSLYSHVAGVEELLAIVQARALRDLGKELQRAAMGASGPVGVRALAVALREFAANHPGRYELAMTQPIDRPEMVIASQAAGEALGAVVRSFGVPELTIELSFSCLSVLHGVLALERAGLYRDAQFDRNAVYDQAVEVVVQIVERAAHEHAAGVGTTPRPKEKK